MTRPLVDRPVRLVLALACLLLTISNVASSSSEKKAHSEGHDPLEEWLRTMQVPENGPFVDEVPRVSRFQEELDAISLNDTERETRRKLAACNTRDGSWQPDYSRPAYGKSCQWMRTPWNCEINGRPDTGYQKWSWRPNNCNIPKFDANYFLDRFRNKFVAFIGDSFANNMAESLMCLIAQKSPNVRRYISRFEGVRVQGMLAVDFNVKILVFPAPYLVKYSKNATDFSKLGLNQTNFYDYLVWTDQLDTQWTIPLKYMDVAIFMSGHWFQVSLGNTVVRARTFLKKNKVLYNIPGADAYHMSLEFVKRWLLRRSGYKGALMFYTYSPSHYTKAWGGAPSYCKATQPFSQAAMYQYAQTDSSSKWASVEKSTMGQSRIKVVDVTLMSQGRPDAHVGKYYGKKSNSKTTYDCTHWCLPGVPDIWNDLLVYKVRTEF